MIYVVLGAPSVGKGTRAKLICQKLNIPHISTGRLIRESKEAYEVYKSVLKDGRLIPDKVMKEMLFERVQKDDAKNGFVLDGYPRSLKQVDDLNEILNKIGKNITKVFLFEAPEQEIYNRALNRRICAPCDKTYGLGSDKKVPTICEKCGRELTVRIEDNPETIKKRLEVYHEQIDPIIDYYTNVGLIEKIDAMDKPEKVLESV